MPALLWYNRRVPPRLPVRAASVVLLGLLAACTPEAGQTSPTATPSLVAYHTATATATPSQPTATLPPIVTPGPSPTPLTHLVEANETLIGIAYEYGVSLEDLLTANPGINPRFLSIGQAILIPGPGGQPVTSLAPTPTPVPVALSAVRCYRTLANSLWCLASAGNRTDAAVEGVTVLVTLLDADGAVLETQAAHTPLRLLPSQGELPLAAFFSAPAPRASSAVVVLISALSASAESRVLPVTVERASDVMGEDRSSWRVQGVATLSAEAPAPAALVAVLVVAYDAGGNPTGLRAWEDESGLEPGASVPFDITVYTLGPPIDHVEVWAEGIRPQ